MGIVVSVIMLYGIVLLWKKVPFQGLRAKAASSVLLAGGVWNAGWYGLQHFNEFWGLAAIVSGVLMIVASVLVVARSSDAKNLVWLTRAVLVALTGCFFFYVVTIIQINLGLPIIE